MNAQRRRTLIEKLEDLPPERLAEVEDYVDFLRSRAFDQALVRSAAKAAEPSFAALWDNEADSAYDKLRVIRSATSFSCPSPLPTSREAKGAPR